MPFAWNVQQVLPDCVAVADLELDMVAGMVRFVMRDRSQVPPCVGRTLSFSCRRGCGGREVGGGGEGAAAYPAGDGSPGQSCLVSGAR